MTSLAYRLVTAFLSLCLLPALVRAQLRLSADAPDLSLTRGLAIDGVSVWARQPINLDAVVALVAAGKLGDPTSPLPKAGDTITPPAGVGGEPRAWREIAANDGGEFAGLRRGGYLLVHITSDAGRVMILEATGHAMVYENGHPRMGDPYGTGAMKLPVFLREGDTAFLFAASGRGNVRARLVKPRADLAFLREDVTLPDVVRGTADLCVAGVPVVNATTRTLSGAIVAKAGPKEGGITTTFDIEPLSVRKIVFRFLARPPATAITLKLETRTRETRTPMDDLELTPRAVDAGATRRITFVSELDGSAQYYAVVPPAPHAAGAAEAPPPGLVLSLHGASVEAMNQAQSYSPKPDLVIVCPTNRRPFGFDWEDWGRADAMEVLRLAAREFGTDPHRQFVTGHSMGGHGTWQLASHYPGLFAAAAPSAGWLSFASYGGPTAQDRRVLGESPFTPVFDRAARSSDTVALLGNLKGRGVYILHGDADDNVPVSQARTARDELAALGIEPEYYEQPGAGHWWDDDGPGAACVDWPPIFALFRRSTLTSPADPEPVLSTPLLDERSLPRGSFKRAFAHRFVLVYGTTGTPEENRRSYAKARFDAEQWWYRGNGGAEVISDTAALRFPAAGHRVLYGNADVNAAWSLIAPGAPVKVARGRASIGERSWTGEDIGVLAVVPGGDNTLIGIVAGTGGEGFRALDRVPYFQSGTGIPEQLVLRADVWTTGFAGVLHAAMPSVTPAADAP